MRVAARQASPSQTTAGAAPQLQLPPESADSERALQRIARGIAPSCASFVTILGVGVLAALAAGEEVFVKSGLSLKGLNPLTAVAVTLAAESLWLLCARQPGLGKRRIAWALALLVLLYGLAKLTVWGLDLAQGWDLLHPGSAFASDLLKAKIHLSALSPANAACLVLLALGLLTLDAGRVAGVSVAELMALALGLTALLLLVAYAYSAAALYGFGHSLPMALYSALSFLLLAMGLLFARPQRGFARVIMSATPGGDSARGLLPVAILVPVLLGGLRLRGERADWYSAELGMTLMVLSLILIQLVIVIWNSILLYRADLQREAIKRRLHHDSLHDTLTGLANRAMFLQRLEAEARRARHYQVPCALLYLDLDGFKQVNDTLGHPAGDRLLQAVAGRLRSCVRAKDLSARLGGDEFVVLLEDTTRPRAYEVARRILDEIAAPYTLDQQPARVGVSIGLAFGGAETQSAETLLKQADVSLYNAKHAGKGCVNPPE